MGAGAAAAAAEAADAFPPLAAALLACFLTLLDFAGSRPNRLILIVSFLLLSLEIKGTSNWPC